MKRLNTNLNKLILALSLIFISTTNVLAEQKTLEISASHTLKFKTTEAVISFDVIGRGPDADISYQDYASQSLNVVTYLRSETEEVKELQTTSFISNPVYNYESQAREVIGFDTISTVSFKVPSDMVAIYLNFLSKNKIDRIHDIKFSAPEDLLESKKEEAIKFAIDKALAKADKVLKQLELRRKAVMKIEIDTSDIRYPKFEYKIRPETQKVSPKPTILPKEQEIVASVTLHIAY
ncbi:MAG: SIMPL domain-containing protein [Rickettsiales bacterium]|jgi:uncharacterized protein|nr:SIMPL domain-containing protein [Rickettsiales bacterium]